MTIPSDYVNPGLVLLPGIPRSPWICPVFQQVPFVLLPLQIYVNLCVMLVQPRLLIILLLLLLTLVNFISVLKRVLLQTIPLMSVRVRLLLALHPRPERGRTTRRSACSTTPGRGPANPA